MEEQEVPRSKTIIQINGVDKNYEVTVDGTTYTRRGRNLVDVSKKPLTLKPNDNWHGLTYWPVWKEKTTTNDKSKGRGSNTGLQMLNTSDANGNEQWGAGCPQSR